MYEESSNLLNGLRIDHRKRKTIPLRNISGKKSSSGHHCMSGIYVQYLPLCDDLYGQGSGTCLFFYRHSTTINFMKENQGGLIPTGLKRWPLKRIEHFADTTCVSPSPAGPAGCCPLNFIYLINLQFCLRFVIVVFPDHSHLLFLSKGFKWMLFTLV